MKERDNSDTLTAASPLTASNWAVWAIPAALLPLVVWRHPLSAILVAAGSTTIPF